jgi:uncharacterized membrane protein YfcA
MLVLAIIFVSALVQGMAGFGGALIAMPLLTTLLGIQVAAPAYALVGTAGGVVNALRWRHHVTLTDVVRLTLPALLAIPLGVWLLGRLDPVVVTRGLGLVLVAYGVYGLVGRALPQLRHRGWPVVVGVASGLLTGAFNTGGPPVVAYADACQWDPNRFRGNLQWFFLATGIFVVFSHAAADHFTRDIGLLALGALPALLLGQWIGVRLGNVFSEATFRRVVLVLLLVLGAQLLLMA